MNQGSIDDPDAQINLAHITETTYREPLNHGIEINKATELSQQNTSTQIGKVAPGWESGLSVNKEEKSHKITLKSGHTGTPIQVLP